MAQHNETGRWGEQIACEKLVKEGYAILDQNWRMGHYEIDIVAQKDNQVIFCEVKTRSGGDFDPIDAIDERKIRHMVSSADVYMKEFNIHYDVRFDVFGISGSPDDYHLEHIEDAFWPPLKRY